MTNMVPLTLVVILAGGCVPSTKEAGPVPDQAAHSIQNDMQDCNSADSECAKPIVPSLH